MIAVVQRVSKAAVVVEGKTTGSIDQGLLVLLGIEDADTQADIEWLARKIVALRIFNDDQEVMNLSLADVSGGMLVVSQFTLHASTRKGNRPSYIKAAKPPIAIPLYEQFLSFANSLIEPDIQAGIFGADMKVSLINDGPVTIIIDTKDKK